MSKGWPTVKNKFVPRGPQDRFHSEESTAKSNCLGVHNNGSTSWGHPPKGNLHCKKQIRMPRGHKHRLHCIGAPLQKIKPVPRGQRDRRHQQESTVKIKFVPRSPKDRRHQKECTTKIKRGKPRHWRTKGENQHLQQQNLNKVFKKPRK